MWKYLRATARHIYLLLVGVIGAALTLTGVVFPALVQIAGYLLLGLGVFGAQFLAWRDMRDARNKASDDLVEAERRWGEREAALLAQLDAREKRKAIRESLGQFVSQGEEIRRWIERAGEPVAKVFDSSDFFGTYRAPKDADDPSLLGWEERAQEWEVGVVDFLEQYLGGSYAAQFKSDLGTSQPEIPDLGSDKHTATWERTDRRLQVLMRFVKEAGEDLLGS